MPTSTETPPPKPDNIMIEDARILFRNFGGRENPPFNAAGDRNFCLILPPDMVEPMREDGWNIKQLKSREEGDEPESYVQVAVNYDKGRPPRVVLITSKNRIELGAGEIEMLDYADIKTLDLVLNPYPWALRGNKGIKAYLKTAYVTINEDELELKYAEGSAVGTMGANEPMDDGDDD